MYKDKYVFTQCDISLLEPQPNKPLWW